MPFLVSMAVGAHGRRGSASAPRAILAAVLALVALTTNAAAQDAVSYQDQIKPILAKTCYSCHGDTKQKGQLRLDSPKAITSGGKNGAVIIAGNAARSPLYARLILPKDDDDVMPAKGDPLTSAQCDLIRRWIEAGAPFGADTTPVAPGAPVAATKPATGSGAGAVVAPGAGPVPAPATGLNAIGQPQAPPVVLPQTLIDQAAENLPAPDATSLKALSGFEVVSMPISHNQAALAIDLSHGTGALDKELAVVEHLGSNVFWLDLKGTAVTNSQLHTLQGLKNLRRLHLERTTIGDDGLSTLSACTHLTYLNLYATKVSDGGLPHLNGLTALEHLYLWESQATSVGIAKLQAVLPKLIIDDVADLPSPPTDGAGKKGKNKKQ